MFVRSCVCGGESDPTPTHHLDGLASDTQTLEARATKEGEAPVVERLFFP